MLTRTLMGIGLYCLVHTAQPARSTAAPARAPAPAPRSARQASQPSGFANVKGWLGLRWKMRLGQVKAKLDSRGIKYKHESRRDQFKHGCVLTDTLALGWKRWKVTASLHQTKLTAIWLNRDRQTAKDVEAIGKKLTRRYGPPNQSVDLHKIKKHGVIAKWTNRHTVLTLSVTRHKKHFRVLRTYQRK